MLEVVAVRVVEDCRGLLNQQNEDNSQLVQIPHQQHDPSSSPAHDHERSKQRSTRSSRRWSGRGG